MTILSEDKTNREPDNLSGKKEHRWGDGMDAPMGLKQREYVWECEMKTREEEDKWEALLHQYDLLLHSETLGKLNIPE